MHIIYRKTCRVCGSKALTEVINLGDQYLQGSFEKPGKEMPSHRKIPMVLMRCDPTKDENACGLLQMQCTVPSEVLYSAYWYRSGTNQTMRDHLKGIVEEAMGIVNKPKATVLDIGCNDGTLLNYYPDNYEKFGIDPSDIAKGIKNNVNVVQDIFPSEELLERLDGKKIDIISSIAMFYDLESPVDFTKSIRQILAPDGIWVFEMSYMPLMLNMNSYDTICHEHLEYYSLAVVESILKRAGMQIVNVSLNDINGGSLRCYATHANNFKFKCDEFAKNIKELREKEFDLELDTDKPYKDFQKRIDEHKEKLRSILMDLKKQGKHIHIYGASTKGNTILQWCGIDNTIIDYAAERNSEKYGAKTIGTNIPIISEEESRKLNPDYYLVLPWHFRDEFLKREKAMLDKGVGFIFPLPDIEIIKKK